MLVIFFFIYNLVMCVSLAKS